MIFSPTRLEGAYIIEMERRVDERGFFARTWCAHEFARHGLADTLVQCGMSHNVKRGTLRGMHYQRAPFGEEKVVQCLAGAIHDVIVDLRSSSSTYCQWLGVELTAHNGRMIYVPPGFAHGLITLADDTRVGYFMGREHAPQAEAGVRFDDPAFGIDWPLPVSVISERDRQWPDHVP